MEFIYLSIYQAQNLTTKKYKNTQRGPAAQQPAESTLKRKSHSQPRSAGRAVSRRAPAPVKALSEKMSSVAVRLLPNCGV